LSTSTPAAAFGQKPLGKKAGEVRGRGEIDVLAEVEMLVISVWSDTARLGTPSDAPSMAAPTVPEIVMQLPIFSP